MEAVGSPGMGGMVADFGGGGKREAARVEAQNVGFHPATDPTNCVILLVTAPGLLYCP